MVRVVFMVRATINSFAAPFGARSTRKYFSSYIGKNGPGIESRWGRDFSHTSRPALEPIQPPVQWVPGLSRGVKRPGRSADHPPPSSAEVKKEYSYTSTPLWAFGSVTGYPYEVLYSYFQTFPQNFASLGDCLLRLGVWACRV
jgi:hypothetical protein